MDQSVGDPLTGSHRLPGYGVHESAVRIESADGKIHGTGVAITPRHIASCAHVIREALGLSVAQIDPPSAALKVTVWRTGKAQTFEVTSYPAWLPESSGDLVVMAMPADAPDLLPACLEELRSDQWQQQTVEVFGFPHGFDQGQPVSLECQMANTDGLIQCRPNREGMDHGHSGGPVFLAGNLVGLGQSRRCFSNPERQFDFIVPVKRLKELAPTLTRIGRRPFFDLHEQLAGDHDKPVFGEQLDSNILVGVRKCNPHTIEEYRLRRLTRDYETADIRLDFTPLLMLLDDKRSDSQFGEERRPDPLNNLNEALEKEFPVYLLKGIPGAGKTTLLKRLAYDCALSSRQALLPVFFELAAHKGSATPEQWLQQQWTQLFGAELPTLAELMQNQDYTILWLLDGLNELPDETACSRTDKVDSWRRWLEQQADRHRVIISCRSADYLDQLDEVAGKSVPHLEVQPLDSDKITEFLVNRSSLSNSQADAAIQRIRERGLEKLYNTPLMLTLLELVLTPEGDFPDGRVDLFATYVFKLVWRELKKPSTLLRHLFSDPEVKAISNALQPSTTEVDRSATRRHLILRPNPLFDALSAQAYEQQRAEYRGERQEVSFDGLALRDAISADCGDERGDAIFNAAQALMLLVQGENEAMLRFRHQQFQEFFAARRLVETFALELVKAPWRPKDFRVSLDRVRAQMKPWQQLPPVDRSGWEETVLLAAELAKDRDGFVTKLGAVNLPLAGQCAAKSKVSAASRENLAAQLLTRMHDAGADLRARIAAGLALGEMYGLEVLGYQRVTDDQGRLVAWRPPLAAIPKGRYTFGSVDDPDAYDNETRFEGELEAFDIGVYPVTNAEWACFIAADGYAESRWWVGDAARAFFDGRGTNEGLAQEWIWWKERYDDGTLEDEFKRSSLEPKDREEIRSTVAFPSTDWDAYLADLRAQSEKVIEPLWWRAMRYSNPLQPVVGVSFFEAAAYCRWLSEVSGRQYTLPSELEWEAAARGDGPRPRIYAFNDEFCGDACNIRETSAMVGAPTPIGLYESGKSPNTGVYDLTGNTWDWTRSVYRETPPYDNLALGDINDASQLRVLRGGSWFSIQRLARAAVRSLNHPGFRNYYVGCRVCCVPLES